MHKKLLATLLSAMLGSSFAVQAIELSVEDKQQMLSDAQSQESAQRIVSLALSEQSDQANFNLLRIKQPQQEVVRFLAIKSISESAPQYTSDLAVFVDTQRKVAPSLKIVEQGDGFRFVSPAFSYQIMAQRLIDDWKLDDQIIELYVGVENEQLDLRAWLTEHPDLTSQREKLLINNIDTISDEGLAYLVEQITDNSVLSWLPSSDLMVAMATRSNNPELYDIVWKMKADSALSRELERLGQDGSDFSIQQMIVASQNPSLSERSLQLLAKYAPTSQPAEDFLVSRMSNQGDAQVITESIQGYGYNSWFNQWASKYPEIFNR
ncbi:hypothetical protein BCU83_08070 [Vibrio breoganii]|uniref:hypothetical protein n=1 Tax=Vibrio breoganii TaxID=553239 RepID=UPI000C8251EB|nr:hypothetical protein [Vibrio breoganii]PMG82131.1 hypothetical protein BCU83_08070 [Vibrio breoganii]